MASLPKAFEAWAAARCAATLIGNQVSVRVPRALFASAFSNMQPWNVTRGLKSLGTASSKKGDTAVVMTLDLGKVREVAGVTAEPNRKAYTKGFFAEVNQAQEEHRTKYEVPGFDPEACPTDFVNVKQTTVKGAAKAAMDGIIDQVRALPDRNAKFCLGGSNFVLRRLRNKVHGFDNLAIMFCFVVNLLRRALRGRDPKNPRVFTNSLRQQDVDDDLWAFISRAQVKLHSQLSELAKIEALKHFISLQAGDYQERQGDWTARESPPAESG